VVISGDIEPERKTSGLMPNSIDAAAARTQMSPATAPIVSASSRPARADLELPGVV